MLLIGSVIGALWFAGFVAAHVALFALRPVQNRSRAIVTLFGLALFGGLATATLVPADLFAGVTPTSHRVVAALAAGLVMACAFILYMPFYYTITTSLSVQTVIAIDEAPGHQLPLDTLTSPQVYDQIVRGRLASMVAAGNVTCQDGRYVATAKGARVARFFAGLKRLWRLGPGG